MRVNFKASSAFIAGKETIFAFRNNIKIQTVWALYRQSFGKKPKQQKRKEKTTEVVKSIEMLWIQFPYLLVQDLMYLSLYQDHTIRDYHVEVIIMSIEVLLVQWKPVFLKKVFFP